MLCYSVLADCAWQFAQQCRPVYICLASTDSGQAFKLVSIMILQKCLREVACVAADVVINRRRSQQIVHHDLSVTCESCASSVMYVSDNSGRLSVQPLSS